MKRVLVDTSAWVEFDRATGSSAEARLTALIASDGPVAVTEPVIMEVLARARNDQRERDLRRLLLRFEITRAKPSDPFRRNHRLRQRRTYLPNLPSTRDHASWPGRLPDRQRGHSRRSHAPGLRSRSRRHRHKASPDNCDASAPRRGQPERNYSGEALLLGRSLSSDSPQTISPPKLLGRSLITRAKPYYSGEALLFGRSLKLGAIQQESFVRFRYAPFCPAPTRPAQVSPPAPG